MSKCPIYGSVHIFKLSFLILTHWRHIGNQFWYQISISQVCHFPSTGGSCYCLVLKKPTFPCFLVSSYSKTDWTLLTVILMFSLSLSAFPLNYVWDFKKSMVVVVAILKKNSLSNSISTENFDIFLKYFNKKGCDI